MTDRLPESPLVMETEKRESPLRLRTMTPVVHMKVSSVLTSSVGCAPVAGDTLRCAADLMHLPT